MSIIQGGRWEAWARHLFSLKGEGEPQSVSPEIILTAPVIPARPEDCLLRGDKLYQGTRAGGLNPTHFGFVNLFNDSDDSVVILEKCYLYMGASSEFDVRMGNNAIGTGPITITSRDTRLGLVLTGKSQAGMIRWGSELAITGSAAQRGVALATTIAEVRCPIALWPGDGVFVWNLTLNDALYVNFLWREREAEPGELRR